jgi:putative ABC transport system ATP-binding protein
MAPILEVRELVKVYRTAADERPALGGISIAIERGEFVAIMGPSGSGKSTLMNILGCLDRPTTGTYTLDGVDVADLDEEQLAEIRATRIGFVFQSFNLLPRATVMRNVVMPMIYTRVPVGEREARAADALRAVGLADTLWYHQSNELSGGQMQRVAIARALVNDPAIVLADEPTGNLDTRTGEIILDTFRKLQQQGRTIVLITHEYEVAEHADRTIHIRDGLLVDEAEARAHDAKIAAAPVLQGGVS